MPVSLYQSHTLELGGDYEVRYCEAYLLAPRIENGSRAIQLAIGNSGHLSTVDQATEADLPEYARSWAEGELAGAMTAWYERRAGSSAWPAPPRLELMPDAHPALRSLVVRGFERGLLAALARRARTPELRDLLNAAFDLPPVETSPIEFHPMP